MIAGQTLRSDRCFNAGRTPRAPRGLGIDPSNGRTPSHRPNGERAPVPDLAVGDLIVNPLLSDVGEFSVARLWLSGTNRRVSNTESKLTYGAAASGQVIFGPPAADAVVIRGNNRWPA